MTPAFALAMLVIVMAFFTMLEGHLIFAFLLVWLAAELLT
jgi:hypothetical protein